MWVSRSFSLKFSKPWQISTAGGSEQGQGGWRRWWGDRQLEKSQSLTLPGLGHACSRGAGSLGYQGFLSSHEACLSRLPSPPKSILLHDRTGLQNSISRAALHSHPTPPLGALPPTAPQGTFLKPWLAPSSLLRCPEIQSFMHHSSWLLLSYRGYHYLLVIFLLLTCFLT